MNKGTISEAVVKRLPKYYAQVRNLDDIGVEKVSSSELANFLGITASQVRQDFYNFGGFGQQGYGYDVKNLKNELAQILGLDKDYNVIIIGAGHIGGALAGYTGFKKDGFYIKALFDIKIKEESINNIPVYSMDCLQQYLKDNKTDIAIISVQASSANDVAKKLIENGIKTIWNFAPIDLKVPNDVVVENISMSESLFVLSYRSNNRNY